jgi:hypothetical protein
MDDLKPAYCPREYAERQSWVCVKLRGVYAAAVLCFLFLR